jgi:glutathione S-transferase
MALMKLFISSTSVFARKVRVVVREKGLTDRVEEIARIPVEAAQDLVAANPLSQIPALIDDSGVAWTDSSLISAWLDTQAGGLRLLPAAGTDAYWQVRRAETAASALTEMMAKIVYENRRPENERSPYWLERWESNLRRAFGVADTLCPEADIFDMGSLSLGVAATFCDFRLDHIEWRKLAPKVAALQEVLERRQSFIETYPK